MRYRRGRATVTGVVHPKKIATVPASRDGKAGVRTGTRSQETCLGHDLMHFAKEGVSRYVSVTT